MQNPISLYIHWPFCVSKCPYCDFNSHVHRSFDSNTWCEAIISELRYYQKRHQTDVVSSIFFGGGTPSLIPPQSIDIILNEIARLWKLSDNFEASLEANPNSSEQDNFKGYKSAGINRLSIGIQSFNEKNLQFLKRAHNSREALKALEKAQTVFDNFSFDLIYTLPNQTLKEWEDELKQALAIGSTHLSLYQLTIEQGTAFHALHARGDLVIPDPDLAADFYNLTQEITTSYKMPAYEISNHAKDGFQCQHNLTYWKYGNYIGVGPGAHGRITIDKQRYATQQIKAPELWLKQCLESGHGTKQQILLDSTQQMEEFLLMGLRLHEGICFDKFKRLFQQDLKELISEKKLMDLVSENLIKLTNESLATTSLGRLKLNSILAYIIR